FSPMLSYALIFMGLIFNITGLFYLGILVFGLMVLFSIITLPVEIDASRRGIK
ncbi:MAG: zinc metallopeptidase, partial [Anaerolineae bacterium]|nr:zinc metallopeptidase [Anaerolineae bacterium]